MVGTRLKMKRIEAGLKQQELARRLGVPEVKVSRWETNRTEMKVEEVVDCARALRCDPNEINPKLFPVIPGGLEKEVR